MDDESPKQTRVEQTRAVAGPSIVKGYLPMLMISELFEIIDKMMLK